MKIKQDFSINFQYDILFTRNLFDTSNPLLREQLQHASPNKKIRVALVVDKGVVDCTPGLLEKAEQYILQSQPLELAAAPLVVVGGEDSKNTTEEFINTLQLINDAKIDRHAFIIAIGGGAVLDMVGFAAAVGHRGIRLVRVPTTVLSQNDSGVGVKNSINYFGKKNFLGTFAPPYAVINDLNFLLTLNDRDWRSGIAEAVKVALIKDRAFFEWLEQNAKALSQRDLDAMEKLVYDCAQLHTDHISNSNDPFEMGSSRPLDFGHWAAHKLEQLTHFELKHGEAVAIGIALDVTYAVYAGFLSQDIADRVLKLLSNLGFQLFHPLLLNEEGTAISDNLIKGLEEFREHLGGELTITLIDKIGEKFDVHEMNITHIEKAALTLLEKQEIHAY